MKENHPTMLILESLEEYSGNEYSKLKQEVSKKENELIELLQTYTGNEWNNPFPQTFNKIRKSK